MGEEIPLILPELGEEFEFTPKYVASVEPDHDAEWERVWFLVIEAKKLENLRKKCDLTPKPFGNKHDFHITIATKLRHW